MVKKKETFREKIESLLMAAQKQRHKKPIVSSEDRWECKQNSKVIYAVDRDQTINPIISECSKLAQKKYKARHDWVSKVIHWEMC